MIPNIATIQEIESRQDEVLRKLAELERQISQTLLSCGDQRFIKSADGGARLLPIGVEAQMQRSEDKAKAA